MKYIIRLLSFVIIFSLVFQTAYAGEQVMSSTQSFETENRFSLNEEALVESHSANRIGDLEIHGDGLKQLANSNPSAPVYIVNNGTSVQFSLIHIYDYINIRSDFAWKLADDGTSKVDKYDWKNKIGVGGILVQTSFDNENWDTVYTNTNVFADYQPAIKNFYSANRSDLSAGCYYKVIIAYKLSKKTEQKHFLFIDTSNWRNTWNIDEYSFFLISDDSSVTAADIDYTPIDMPDQTKVGDVGIDFSNATVSNRIAGEESNRICCCSRQPVWQQSLPFSPGKPPGQGGRIGVYSGSSPALFRAPGIPVCGL